MAGVQIGALHISLSADSAAFDKGMDKVEDRSKEAAKKIEEDGEKMSDAIKGYAAEMAAGLAAAFAIGNMAQRIKEQIDYADSLADVAARSLQSAEALSAFEYALHFQDATIQDYTDGLQKMSQNIAAASEGAKEQSLIFETLGIELRDNQQMLRNSGDVMMDFANVMANMADGATKTQLAMDILGKSAGPALLPFLSQGKEGIEEFTKEAERMGLVISTEFSNQAGELNDTLDKIGFSATGAWRVIAADLTPALTDLGKAFLDITEKSDATQQALTVPLEVILRGVGTVAIAFEGLVELTGQTFALVAALAKEGFQAAFENPFGEQQHLKAFNAILNDPAMLNKMREIRDRLGVAVFGVSDAEQELSKEKQNLAELDVLLTKWMGEEAVKEYEAEKKRRADKAANAEKAKAQALKDAEDIKKAREKILQDVVKLEQGFLTPLQLENQAYNNSVTMVLNAIKEKVILEDRGNEALRLLAIDHEDKLDKIRHDAMDAAFNAWKADEDRRIAAQKVIDEEKERIAAGKKEGFDFVSGIVLDGSGELARLDAEHNAKMTKLAELREAEKISDEEYFLAKEEAERQHAARRLDIQLGTGGAISKLSEEFNKGMLKGTLQFFAADFGGFAAHSRKVFEAQKAAKTAQILINIPETVSNAIAAGSQFGPWGSAAFAAAALASQLGQLKAIQSQSFGGGSSSGGVVGGAPPALPSSSSPTSQADQRAEQGTPQVTYVRIPEDAILTGRKMLDFIDEAMGDGKQLNNLRFIPT